MLDAGTVPAVPFAAGIVPDAMFVDVVIRDREDGAGKHRDEQREGDHVDGGAVQADGLDDDCLDVDEVADHSDAGHRAGEPGRAEQPRGWPHAAGISRAVIARKNSEPLSASGVTPKSSTPGWW